MFLFESFAGQRGQSNYANVERIGCIPVSKEES